MRRDNITKMRSEISNGSVHRFIGTQLKTKKRTKLDRFRLVRFGFESNQTRSDTFSVWIFGFIGFVRTTYTPTYGAIIILKLTRPI